LSTAAEPTESDSRKASNNLQGHKQQQQELTRHYKLLDTILKYQNMGILSNFPTSDVCRYSRFLLTFSLSCSFSHPFLFGQLIWSPCCLNFQS
jgi:hypothetical protein